MAVTLAPDRRVCAIGRPPQARTRPSPWGAISFDLRDFSTRLLPAGGLGAQLFSNTPNFAGASRGPQKRKTFLWGAPQPGNDDLNLAPMGTSPPEAQAAQSGLRSRRR